MQWCHLLRSVGESQHFHIYLVSYSLLLVLENGMYENECDEVQEVRLGKRVQIMDLDSQRQNEQGAILHDISTSFTCIVLKGGIIY